MRLSNHRHDHATRTVTRADASSSESATLPARPMLTQYYTATSLDGFIADADNSLGWLFTRDRDEHGPLNYGDFIADVGALAMGSTTYEWILDHEFSGKDPAEWKWPYDIPGWVFTHRELPLVPDSPIEFTSA